MFVARAVVAYDERRFDDALAALRQALELYPEHLDAIYYTGLTLFALGRLDEAKVSFERVLSRQPDDDASLFQLGLMAMSRGNYDEAERPLERAFAINPKRDGLGYYVGMLRYRRQNYTGAVQAFRTGVTSNPEVQSLARFYTGLAMTGLGRNEDIASELDEALRVQPASPLTGAAERLRQSVLAGRQKDKRFRAELRVGAFYDDNVPAAPDESPDTFIQALRRKQQTSFGELVGVQGEYTLLRRPTLETIVGYSFYSGHNNDIPRLNIMSHLGTVAATYRTSIATLPVYLSLPYTYDYFALGGEHFLQRHIVAPWAGVAEGTAHFTTFQLRYMNKDFFENQAVAVDDKRDAENWMVGIGHLMRFARDQHLLRIGYQWDTEDARGKNLSYDGHRMLFGAQYTLPWGQARLNYDFDVHLRRYHYLHTSLPTDAPNTRRRSDQEYTHILRISVPLPRDFGVAVQYQLTQANSNLDLFDYTRNAVFVYVTWSY